jgi:hypothetical protein
MTAELTIDQIIAWVREKASGRTRYVGMETHWDERLVAEIDRLRNLLVASNDEAINAQAQVKELKNEVEGHGRGR